MVKAVLVENSDDGQERVAEDANEDIGRLIKWRTLEKLIVLRWRLC